MTEKKIKLNATNEVQEFVNAASECNFDINLHYQRAIVDAKSFLGVLSLGLSKIFTVSYGGNDGNFEQILSKKQRYIQGRTIIVRPFFCLQ